MEGDVGPAVHSALANILDSLHYCINEQNPIGSKDRMQTVRLHMNLVYQNH